MPNEERNNTIDYSKFFKQERKKPEIVPEKKKKFSFGGLGSFWAEADKKIKIELVIFIGIIVVTAFVLIFYFTQSKPKIPESPIITPPSGEEEMLVP